MDVFSKIVLALAVLSQVDTGCGFGPLLQPFMYGGGKTTKAHEKLRPTFDIVRDDNSSTSTATPEKENSTGPVIFVPVIHEVILDPDDYYSMMQPPPPYPMVFAGRPDNLPFVPPPADHFQEPFFPVNDYPQYFPAYAFQPLETLPLQYYSASDQTAFQPVAHQPVESSTVPAAKPTATSNNKLDVTSNKLEHANSYNENEDVVLKRILKIVKEFMRANQTNLYDLRFDTRLEEVNPTIPMSRDTTLEPKTTASMPKPKNITSVPEKSTSTTELKNTYPESETSTFSMSSTTAETEGDGLRMVIPVRSNRTNDNRTPLKLPSRRVIGQFFDENGNPCVKEVLPSHQKYYLVFTCEEKGVLKTTSKSDVIHYTNELTSTTELPYSGKSNDSIANSTTDTTTREMEQNDFVFVEYN